MFLDRRSINKPAGWTVLAHQALTEQRVSTFTLLKHPCLIQQSESMVIMHFPFSVLLYQPGWNGKEVDRCDKILRRLSLLCKGLRHRRARRITAKMKVPGLSMYIHTYKPLLRSVDT